MTSDHNDEPFITPLRALVQTLGPQDAEAPETILLDIDLEGSRYLLVRMPPARKTCPLSPREIEIVRLVASGHPNKVIAALLDISAWTVCTHLRRIFAKLNVTTRAAMVARLADFGLPKEFSAPSPPPPQPAAHSNWPRAVCVN
jgi:DNA-binding CsgD family transcriptional regulator